jgi:hypothetical protein
MTHVVSISDLRKNIADYVDRVWAGDEVLIKDEKKDITKVRMTKVAGYDKVRYEKALRRVAGIFTAKNHPEWRTKKDIVNWLNNSRKADERTF